MRINHDAIAHVAKRNVRKLGYKKWRNRVSTYFVDFSAALCDFYATRIRSERGRETNKRTCILQPVQIFHRITNIFALFAAHVIVFLLRPQELLRPSTRGYILTFLRESRYNSITPAMGTCNSVEFFNLHITGLSLKYLLFLLFNYKLFALTATNLWSGRCYQDWSYIYHAIFAIK